MEIERAGFSVFSPTPSIQQRKQHLPQHCVLAYKTDLRQQRQSETYFALSMLLFIKGAALLV